MPTRKQRRRAQKERRHDYETVWVDEEGNELEEPPEDLVPPPRERNENGKPKPKAKTQPQRGGRQVRVPPRPSWQRAAKRSLIIGGALFAVIYVLGSKGGHSVAGALILAVIYTAIFIPAQYTIDRFAYNRWQRREAQQAAKRPAKKR
jgi:hypothetical protein